MLQISFSHLIGFRTVALYRGAVLAGLFAGVLAETEPDDGKDITSLNDVWSQ